MTSEDPAGQRSLGDDVEVPPEVQDLMDATFGQLMAKVYMTYGSLGVDPEAVTRQAFRLMVEIWPVHDRFSWINQTVLKVAAEATKGRRPTKELGNVSIYGALGSILTSEIRDALVEIDRLPTRMKVAFLGVRVFQMPIRDVARVLDLPEVTVRAHLSKATRKLTSKGIDEGELINELGRLV